MGKYDITKRVNLFLAYQFNLGARKGNATGDMWCKGVRIKTF